jgi:3-isopropylmalate/(R)-2-methylmalate dehydratase large subunit
MTTPQTFAQKALARAAGLPMTTVGQVVDARPDRILSHDNSAAIRKIFAQFGLARIHDPARLAITLDHAAPPPTPVHAQNHAEIRAFVREQGIPHFFEVGRGICHQVLSEEALVLPGQLVLGADSHTTHFGWLGAFGTGVGRSEVAVLWATGELWMRVPESLRIHLDGTLPLGVTTKDLCLSLIGQLGADGGLYNSIEFTGQAISQFSLESRMVIPNMMAEFGAKNAYLAPDEAVFDWLAARLTQRTGQPLAECREQVAADALYPDAAAQYTAEHHIDLNTLEPLLACPHRPDNVQPVSALAGTAVDVCWIGTCTNGRLEDLAVAAEIMRGKKVAPNTRLMIIPASSEVMLQASRAGYLTDLLAAGAVINSPGCGPCMGNHMGIPAVGEVVLTSANRNFRGRMGQPAADMYLASPAVVAASAITGKITDPRALK